MRMSCFLTVEQVLAETKTATRRLATTWARLKVGDELILVEKAQGLKKGQQQRILKRVVITGVDLVDLFTMTAADCAAEGFPTMEPADFIEWWLAEHKVTATTFASRWLGLRPSYDVRLITWRYLPPLSSELLAT